MEVLTFVDDRSIADRNKRPQEHEFQQHRMNLSRELHRETVSRILSDFSWTIRRTRSGTLEWNDGQRLGVGKRVRIGYMDLLNAGNWVNCIEKPSIVCASLACGMQIGLLFITRSEEDSSWQIDLVGIDMGWFCVIDPCNMGQERQQHMFSDADLVAEAPTWQGRKSWQLLLMSKEVMRQMTIFGSLPLKGRTSPVELGHVQARENCACA